MTEPVYTYSRWTLEQECCAQGIQVPEGPLTCDHHCRRLCEADALFDAQDYPELSGDWVCITCFSGIDREEAVAAETEARPAPSWDVSLGCEQAKFIRAERRRKLMESDWTVGPSSPLTADVQSLWAEYRQQLRDLTSVFASPADLIWPQSPEGHA